MGNTLPQSISDEPTSQNAALQPDMIDEIGSESYAIIAKLTPLQQQVMLALIDNTLSEDKQTDGQIAEKCNTSRDYVWKLRRQPKFASAMGLLIKSIAIGTADKAFVLLMKHAEKDPGSVKTWLQMSGVHVDRRQNLNINANLSATQQDTPGSPTAYGMQVVENFIAFGYDIESLHTLIDKCYDTLKAQGI